MKKPRSKPSPDERRGANRTETAALPAHSDASLPRPAAELPPAEAARGARRSAGTRPAGGWTREEDAGERDDCFHRKTTDASADERTKTKQPAREGPEARARANIKA